MLICTGQPASSTVALVPRKQHTTPNKQHAQQQRQLSQQLKQPWRPTTERSQPHDRPCLMHCMLCRCVYVRACVHCVALVMVLNFAICTSASMIQEGCHACRKEADAPLKKQSHPIYPHRWLATLQRLPPNAQHRQQHMRTQPQSQSQSTTQSRHSMRRVLAQRKQWLCQLRH